MNGRDVGRLASRFVAALLALRAVSTVPALISILLTPGTRLPGGDLTSLLVSTLLPLALAALCWWEAPAVATMLLAPGAGSGVWPSRALETTIFRAVGLYMTLSAILGIVFWIATLAVRVFPGFDLPILAEAVLAFALGLALVRWAPQLARWLDDRRR